MRKLLLISFIFISFTLNSNTYVKAVNKQQEDVLYTILRLYKHYPANTRDWLYEIQLKR